MEYGAIVDAGASYDSVPEGLAERRGRTRVSLKDQVKIITANEQATSDFAIITKILGMPEEMRAAELGTPPSIIRREALP